MARVYVCVATGQGFPARSGRALAGGGGETGWRVTAERPGGAHQQDGGTELAWEMSRRVLQQHKLQRTPIKLVVRDQ